MNVIVVGCGRVGVELALSICRKHVVTVVDPKPLAFDRLGADFHGRAVRGDGLDKEALLRAGIENAEALAAVTNSDNVNVVVARITRDLFHIPRVIARVYNPRRALVYEKLGIQTVASSSWGAMRIEQYILNPGLESVFSAGNGEVQLYEIIIPQAWDGHPLGDLMPEHDAQAMAVVRSGKAKVPDRSFLLHAQDILHIGATGESITVLNQHLHAYGKE